MSVPWARVRAMRLLHTSDWHLGRSLHRADLRAAQSAFLDHLVDVARAEKVDGGYKVNGTKIWTSNAHISDYAIALFRTKVVPDKKHEGLSQFLVDLKSEGIGIRPIIDLAGRLFSQARAQLGEEADYLEAIKLIEGQAGVAIRD